MVSPEQRSKRESNFTTEILLCKTDNPDGVEKSHDETNHASKLAPVFRKPTKIKREKNEGKQFPDEYCDAFHGKRGVNLYVQNSLVVWEFSYNATIIRAIKEHIKGRAWNPNIGAKGCWTCPIESLPDAVKLYEHMGRSASPELKKRAYDIEQSLGGASASDTIALTINLSFDDPGQGCWSFGCVVAKFLYDADIISVLKMLPPTQRTYDPVTKAWTFDLLGLPSVLENLSPLGYRASTRLKDISDKVTSLEMILWGGDNADGSVSDMNIVDGKGKVHIENENDSQQPVSVPQKDTNGDDAFSSVEQQQQPTSKPSMDVNDKTQQLDKELKLLVSLIKNTSDNRNTIDKSDCGISKRRKLTPAKKSWASDFLGDSDDDDNEYDDFFYGDIFTTFAASHIKHANKMQDDSTNCDCGRPWKKVNGKHTCRYFGTFHCDCGNTWTSAYCWKGEMQSCRRCNKESLPARKEKLDGRIGMGTGAPHDSARCGRCRTLGYNCNLLV
mmetsp:Transcript_69204/g.102893  ORF Transcript_69204/g.102893 Transcript_69204/m.102893 type:complete len:500 (+) Transcript_69204:356-1855(+)